MISSCPLLADISGAVFSALLFVPMPSAARNISIEVRFSFLPAILCFFLLAVAAAPVRFFLTQPPLLFLPPPFISPRSVSRLFVATPLALRHCCASGLHRCHPFSLLPPACVRDYCVAPLFSTFLLFWPFPFFAPTTLSGRPLPLLASPVLVRLSLLLRLSSLLVCCPCRLFVCAPVVLSPSSVTCTSLPTLSDTFQAQPWRFSRRSSP